MLQKYKEKIKIKLGKTHISVIGSEVVGGAATIKSMEIPKSCIKSKLKLELIAN